MHKHDFAQQKCGISYPFIRLVTLDLSWDPLRSLDPEFSWCTEAETEIQMNRLSYLLS